jgi:hypothetical protein
LLGTDLHQKPSRLMVDKASKGCVKRPTKNATKIVTNPITRMMLSNRRQGLIF